MPSTSSGFDAQRLRDSLVDDFQQLAASSSGTLRFVDQSSPLAPTATSGKVFAFNNSSTRHVASAAAADQRAVSSSLATAHHQQPSVNVNSSEGSHHDVALQQQPSHRQQHPAFYPAFHNRHGFMVSRGNPSWHVSKEGGVTDSYFCRGQRATTSGSVRGPMRNDEHATTHQRSEDVGLISTPPHQAHNMIRNHPQPSTTTTTTTCHDSYVQYFVDECIRHGVPDDVVAQHAMHMIHSMQDGILMFSEIHRLRQEELALTADVRDARDAAAAADHHEGQVERLAPRAVASPRKQSTSMQAAAAVESINLSAVATTSTDDASTDVLQRSPPVLAFRMPSQPSHPQQSGALSILEVVSAATQTQPHPRAHEKKVRKRDIKIADEPSGGAQQRRHSVIATELQRRRDDRSSSSYVPLSPTTTTAAVNRRKHLPVAHPAATSRSISESASATSSSGIASSLSSVSSSQGDGTQHPTAGNQRGEGRQQQHSHNAKTSMLQYNQRSRPAALSSRVVSVPPNMDLRRPVVTSASTQGGRYPTSQVTRTYMSTKRRFIVSDQATKGTTIGPSQAALQLQRDESREQFLNRLATPARKDDDRRCGQEDIVSTSPTSALASKSGNATVVTANQKHGGKNTVDAHQRKPSVIRLQQQQRSSLTSNGDGVTGNRLGGTIPFLDPLELPHTLLTTAQFVVDESPLMPPVRPGAASTIAISNPINTIATRRHLHSPSRSPVGRDGGGASTSITPPRRRILADDGTQCDEAPPKQQTASSMTGPTTPTAATTFPARSIGSVVLTPPSDSPQLRRYLAESRAAIEAARDTVHHHHHQRRHRFVDLESSNTHVSTQLLFPPRRSVSPSPFSSPARNNTYNHHHHVTSSLSSADQQLGVAVLKSFTDPQGSPLRWRSVSKQDADDGGGGSGPKNSDDVYGGRYVVPQRRPAAAATLVAPSSSLTALLQQKNAAPRRSSSSLPREPSFCDVSDLSDAEEADMAVRRRRYL